jgi:hypothetical protein
MLVQELLPLDAVATQLGNQVRPNGDDARAPFAMLDLEDAAIEVDVGRAQPDCLAQSQPVQ